MKFFEFEASLTQCVVPSDEPLGKRGLHLTRTNTHTHTQLKSNAEGRGCKSYETDSGGRDTTAPSRSRLYHLPVFVLEASSGVFVYAYLHASSAYIIPPVVPREGQHDIFIGPPIIPGEEQNNALTACTIH